jgi:hypothetical protein
MTVFLATQEKTLTENGRGPSALQPLAEPFCATTKPSLDQGRNETALHGIDKKLRPVLRFQFARQV